MKAWLDICLLLGRLKSRSERSVDQLRDDLKVFCQSMTNTCAVGGSARPFFLPFSYERKGSRSEVLVLMPSCPFIKSYFQMKHILMGSKIMNLQRSQKCWIRVASLNKLFVFLIKSRIFNFFSSFGFSFQDNSVLQTSY